MIGRIVEAINVLLGRPLDSYLGWRSPVHTRPEAWRCSICGGGLDSGPPGRPLIHQCGKTRIVRGRRIRYVGLRAHAARVWGAVWGNRPRWASAQPGQSDGPSPRTRISDDGRSIELDITPGLSAFNEASARRRANDTRQLLSWRNGQGDPFGLNGGSEL